MTAEINHPYMAQHRDDGGKFCDACGEPSEKHPQKPIKKYSEKLWPPPEGHGDWVFYEDE